MQFLFVTQYKSYRSMEMIFDLFFTILTSSGSFSSHQIVEPTCELI